MKKVCTISLDGLHRSGKGTQLSQLKEYINKQSHFVKIMRGHGSRKGEGSVDDPYSPWWISLQPSLRALDTNGMLLIDPWKDASDRLNEEINQEYIFLNSQENLLGLDPSYILLDRSIISHYYMMNRHNSSIKLEDVLEYTSTHGDSQPVIIPDISFIIHVTQSHLLQRNEAMSDHPDKYEFRKNNIIAYYESFEYITKHIDSELINVKHIDGNKAPEQVFSEIKGILIDGNYV